MNINRPTDLLFDQLKDLYSAESQIILTLPQLAEQAGFPGLKTLLAGHERQSIDQKNILQRIFDRHGVSPDGEVCKAIHGLIEGGNAHLAKACDPQTRDLLLIAHCNRIKHYEIAGYGFSVALAECLGKKDAGPLSSILDEEKEFTHRLALLAADIFGPCMAGPLS